MTCRAEVDAMSPRLASPITGTSLGIRARTRSSATHPAAPKASKNARFGFTAAANGRQASSTRLANRSTPSMPALKPGGRPAGSGSMPRQSTLPTATLRAASRSRYVNGTDAVEGMPPFDCFGATVDFDSVIGRRSWRAGAWRAGRVGSICDHRRRRRERRQLLGRDEPGRSRVRLETRRDGECE